MRDLRPATWLLVAALSTILVPAGVDAVHAAEAPRHRGSDRFACQSEGDAAAEPTPVSFALSTTSSSVRPGDVVSLSGRLTMTLPDSEAEKSELTLAGKVKIDSTDFELVVRSGGETTRVEPASLTSAPAPVRRPFTLSAQVAYPDVTIPETAVGEVVIEMPAGRTRPTSVPGAPDDVTFNVALMQDSVVVPERKLACWRAKAGPRVVITRLPVDARPSDSGSAGGGVTTTDPPGQATDGGADPGATSEQVLAGEDAAPAEAPAATSAAAADPPEVAVPAEAPIPSASVSDDTFVPGWVLALLIALFPAAAIAHAVRQRRRLRGLLAQSTLR